MDFNEAKDLLKNNYINMHLKLVEERENELLFTDGGKSQILIPQEDIVKFMEVENSKNLYETKPTECSICNTNYREQLTKYQNSRTRFLLRDSKFYFGNENGNKPYGEISPASDTFINFFRFDESASELFHGRLQRGSYNFDNKYEDKDEPISITELLSYPITIKVYNINADSINKAISISNPVVDACLFELAYLKNLSLQTAEEWKSRRQARRPFRISEPYEGNNLPLRSAKYNPDVLRFYSRGISTEDPVNKFLSFYHVIEYFFISVSDKQLYLQLSRRINDPKFSTTPKHLDRLIQETISFKRENDETEMLKLVLDKFTDKEEVLEFVKAYEEYQGERIYSRKQKLFGKDIEVKLETGQILKNLATRIKTIRNALVHSSDKYERQERYIPSISSEKMLIKEIPLIKYLAEKVIIGSASD